MTAPWQFKHSFDKIQFWGNNSILSGVVSVDLHFSRNLAAQYFAWIKPFLTSGECISLPQNYTTKAVGLQLGLYGPSHIY